MLFRLGLLAIRNLTRNRVRTFLTAASVFVLAAVYAFARSGTIYLAGLVSVQTSQTRLLVTERWSVPSSIPVRLTPSITNTPGVEEWTAWHLTYGSFGENAGREQMGAGIATRADNFEAMQPMPEFSRSLGDALRATRNGALVGPGLMSQMGWRVGQRFTFRQAAVGPAMELRIIGVLPPGIYSSIFFFRDDYYREASGDKETTTVIWLRVADAAAGQRVAVAIEQAYSTGPVELKVETESAAMARNIGRVKAIVTGLNVVVIILLVDLALILSNSVALSVREQFVEMAVLKALGFQPAHVMGLVLGQAVILGLVAGAAGGASVFVSAWFNAAGYLPVHIGALAIFPIPFSVVVEAVAIGGLAGLIGSLLPAWRSAHIRAVQAFTAQE